MPELTPEQVERDRRNNELQKRIQMEFLLKLPTSTLPVGPDKLPTISKKGGQ